MSKIGEEKISIFETCFFTKGNKGEKPRIVFIRSDYALITCFSQKHTEQILANAEIIGDGNIEITRAKAKEILPKSTRRKIRIKSYNDDHHVLTHLIEKALKFSDLSHFLRKHLDTNESLQDFVVRHMGLELTLTKLLQGLQKIDDVIAKMAQGENPEELEKEE